MWADNPMDFNDDEFEAWTKGFDDDGKGLYERTYVDSRFPTPKSVPINEDPEFQAWLNGTVEALNRRQHVSGHIVVTNPHRQNWHVRLRAAVSSATQANRNLSFNLASVYIVIGLLVLLFLGIAGSVTTRLLGVGVWYWITVFPACFLLIPYWIHRAYQSEHDVIRFSTESSWGQSVESAKWSARIVLLTDYMNALMSFQLIALGMWQQKTQEALDAIIETRWRVAVMSRINNSHLAAACDKQVKECRELTETIGSQVMIGSSGPHAEIVARDVAFLLEGLKELDE